MGVDFMRGTGQWLCQFLMSGLIDLPLCPLMLLMQDLVMIGYDFGAGHTHED